MRNPGLKVCASIFLATLLAAFAYQMLFPRANFIGRESQEPADKTSRFPKQMTQTSPSAERKYEAADGSFSCLLPEGWTARVVDLQGTQVHVFEPPQSNGQQVVMLLTGSIDPSVAALGIQGLAQNATSVVYQNFPFVIPQGPPRFFKVNGQDAAELSYAGQNPMTGVNVKVWTGVMQKDQEYYGLLAVGNSRQAEDLHAQARVLFQTIRPAAGQDTTSRQGSGWIEQALVGTWTYYHGSGGAGGSGSISKSMTFYPNGTYSYTSNVSISAKDAGFADREQTVQGTYRLVGENTLILISQSGERMTVRIQLVRQGGSVQAIIADGETWIK